MLGIDIGTTSVKVAWTKKSGHKTELISAGAAKSPVKGVRSESVEDLTGVSEVVKKLLADANIKVREAVVGLTEHEVTTKVFEMPLLSDSELVTAVGFEAEQYVARPIGEMNMAYEVVYRPKAKEEKMKVLLVATPKTTVERYLKVMEMAGIRVVAVEGELMAASRSVVSSEGGHVVVDMGASATDVGIVDGGRLVFTRSIPTGGEALTRAISVGLSMDTTQAESYKKAYGLTTSQLEGKVAGAIKPVVEAMADEISKTIEFYKSQSNADVKSIVLTGGTAGLPEIVPLIASKIGREVIIGDPFGALEKSAQAAQALSGYGPLYPIAVGLSMKEV